MTPREERRLYDAARDGDTAARALLLYHLQRGVVDPLEGDMVVLRLNGGDADASWNTTYAHMPDSINLQFGIKASRPCIVKMQTCEPDWDPRDTIVVDPTTHLTREALRQALARCFPPKDAP